MALKVESDPDQGSQEALDDEFAVRLEASLDRADVERRRHHWLQRMRAVVPLAILVVPILVWRLGGASHDGLRAAIDAVAWTAFLLDVGVHIDTGVLAYLGLRLLPALVGCLIFALVATTLLYTKSSKQ